jgi:hypothetical protein
VSDNYFRPRWVGLGERRLKNVTFVLEVDPSAMPFFSQQQQCSGDADGGLGMDQRYASSKVAAAEAAMARMSKGAPPSSDPGALIGAAHEMLVAQGRDPSGAAAEALQLVRANTRVFVFLHPMLIYLLPSFLYLIFTPLLVSNLGS